MVDVSSLISTKCYRPVNDDTFSDVKKILLNATFSMFKHIKKYNYNKVISVFYATLLKAIGIYQGEKYYILIAAAEIHPFLDDK